MRERSGLSQTGSHVVEKKNGCSSGELLRGSRESWT